MRFVDPDGRAPSDWVRWTSASGVKGITYDRDIKTKAQAQAKGYTNVSEVFSSANTHSEKNGVVNEIFDFHKDGRVSDFKGDFIDIKDGFNSEGGTHISYNKIGIEQLSSALQDSGDIITNTGFGLTATVIGAPLGVILSSIGGVLSASGAGVEAYDKISNGDLKKGGQKAGFLVAGFLADKAIDKVLPGNLDEGIMNTIINQSVGLQLNYSEKGIEEIQKRENE